MDLEIIIDIRKIIERRLEKIEYEYELISGGKPISILLGKIEAYQDCLNLLNKIPAPRTEQEILKDFEKLGYKVVVNNEDELDLRYRMIDIWHGIRIYKDIKSYEPYIIIKTEKCPVEINMQEHKLLNELFEVWGWL